MFQITGAFAEFERSLIRQRVHAGLKRAVANGKTLGRPLKNPEAIDKARGLLGKGLGINKVAAASWLSNTTVARLKAERTSVVSGRDSPADLPNCGSLGQSNHAINQRDVKSLPSGPTNGSPIAVRDDDQIFNKLQIKKLADTLKLPALGDDPQFAQSLRMDVRVFIEAKGLLNNPRLREAIDKLYRLTARAEGNDQAAGSLARAIDATPPDVWDWLLTRCTPKLACQRGRK